MLSSTSQHIFFCGCSLPCTPPCFVLCTLPNPRPLCSSSALTLKLGDAGCHDGSIQLQSHNDLVLASKKIGEALHDKERRRLELSSSRTQSQTLMSVQRRRCKPGIDDYCSCILSQQSSTNSCWMNLCHYLQWLAHSGYNPLRGATRSPQQLYCRANQTKLSENWGSESESKSRGGSNEIHRAQRLHRIQLLQGPSARYRIHCVTLCVFAAQDTAHVRHSSP